MNGDIFTKQENIGVRSDVVLFGKHNEFDFEYTEDEMFLRHQMWKCEEKSALFYPHTQRPNPRFSLYFSFHFLLTHGMFSLISGV